MQPFSCEVAAILLSQQKKVQQYKKYECCARPETKRILTGQYGITSLYRRNLQLVTLHIYQENGKGKDKTHEPEGTEAKQELQGKLLLQVVQQMILARQEIVTQKQKQSGMQH